MTDRETYFYYNSGYTILGKIVEAVTGTSYSTYVKEEIFSPLAMERSTFARDSFEADEDTITPYVKQDGSSRIGSSRLLPVLARPFRARYLFRTRGTLS